MELSVFSFGQSAASWAMLDEYLELRCRKFVGALNWSIWNDERIEFDQYDNPNTWYSLISHSGRVVAGARLIPSDKEWHGWHNLLVDAQRGMIPAIPPSVLPGGFDFSGSFECSRLVVDEDRLDASQRRTALQMLVGGLVQSAQAQSAQSLMSLSPPTLLRSLRGAGFEAEFLGTRYTCPDDGRAYRVLSMDVARNTAQCTENPPIARLSVQVA